MPKQFGFAYWQSQADVLKKLYYDEKLNTNQIGAIYGVYGETISANMNRLGFQLRTIGTDERINAKYKVDVAFFDDITTEEQAYTLGFFVTDGCITANNRFMISVQYRDRDILEKIRTAMKCNAPIITKKKTVGQDVSTFAITSKHFQDTFQKMGVDNHKTYDLDIERVAKCVPPE